MMDSIFHKPLAITTPDAPAASLAHTSSSYQVLQSRIPSLQESPPTKSIETMVKAYVLNLSASFSTLQSVPGGPPRCLRLAYQAESMVSALWPVVAFLARETEVIVTYRLWRIRRLDTRAIEKKTDSVGHLALPVTERIHELLERCGPLDLEKDLVIVIRDLDIEMLRLGRFDGIASCPR